MNDRPTPTCISVDLETGGTDLGASPIISIGACLATHDWEAEWDRLADTVERAGEMTGSFSEPHLFYCELQPPRWAPWNVESEQFHGLSRERLATRTHPVAALQAFVAWVASTGPAPHRLVSHNASFDWAHLAAHFVRYEVADPFDPFPACTKNIARGVFRADGDAMSGQTALRETLGMRTHLGPHNALADALSQAVLYQRLLSTPPIT